MQSAKVVGESPDVFAPFLEDYLPENLDQPATAEADVVDGQIHVVLDVSEKRSGDFSLPAETPTTISPDGMREICHGYGYAITDWECAPRLAGVRAEVRIKFVVEPLE